MKKRLLALLLALCLAGCAAAPAEPSPPPEEQEDPPAISEAALPEGAVRPLELPAQLPRPSGAEGLEPYGDYWYNAAIRADLSDNPLLAYSLTISDTTAFPEAGMLPEGYDPYALLAWGMDPGLNVDILHRHGFTGKGAVIAYVDQNVLPHEQYDRENIHISNQAELGSMHGPAVLSLLAGRDTGTAPEAEVYFYGFSPDDAAQRSEADALYQIIEQNKSLPEGEKITMVGFSDNIDSSENYEQEFRDAAAACQEAGIMVWFCGEYAPATFLPYGGKNDCRNLVIEQWFDPNYADDRVFVPSSGRTTAMNTGSGPSYVYWPTGGLSWTMPYVLGLYAIAIEIDPTLTQEEMRELLMDTAYDVRGMDLVNPVGFVSGVLRRVGRDGEADAMEQEAAERTSNSFTYVVSAYYNQAVRDYLASLTDTAILAVEPDAAASGEALRAGIEADAARRGGTVKELILFGSAVELAGEGEAPYAVTLFPDMAAIPKLRPPAPGPELAEQAAAMRELSERAIAAQGTIRIGDTPQELPFTLSEQRPGWEIHSLTAQAAEDGMIRFTLEYTVPEGLGRFVFDPPNGDRISLSDFPPTSGERESTVFSLRGEDLILPEGFSISFWSTELESPVFVFPDWLQIILPG